MIVIGYTLFGAVRSSNFDISQLHILFFTFLLIVSVLVTLVLYYRDTKLVARMRINKWTEFFMKYRKNITIGTFILIILVQIYVLNSITAPIGWDVGHIFKGVNALPENPERINRYLSINPNNSFFAFFMYRITNILNSFSRSGTLGESWIAWQLMNTQFLNLGFILLFLAAKEAFNKSTAYITFYLALIPLALSPWLLVPYTDIIMIPVISFIFWLYAKAQNLTSTKHILFLYFLIGIMVSISYLLKPSSIVFLIAWVIIKVVKMLDFKYKGINSKMMFLTLLVTIVGFGSALGGFRYFQEQQSLIETNEEMAKPWEHFVNMGLKGDGGYNSEDSEQINSLPDQDSKKEYARTEIVKRLKAHGPLGYIQFLMEKHFGNTDRGDFGWGTDGGNQVAVNAPDSRIDEILQDTYYQNGHNVGNIRFFMQIMWIITLIGLVFTVGIRDPNHYTQVLKLGILGALLFLLLFEGGRSRYLFQFLPMIYILAGVGIKQMFSKFKGFK